MRTGTEEHLQQDIARALVRLGIPFEREPRLSGKDRPDFMVGGVAVEVKIKGGVTEVTRQLSRYAQHERVSELLLVTSRMQLVAVPTELNGKPVRVAMQWGFL